MSADPTVPRYSDARVTKRGLVGVLCPVVGFIVVASLLLPRPEPALGAGLLGSALLIVVVVLGVTRVRLRPVRPV